MTKLRIATLFIVAVVVTGVMGYHFLEGYTWLESLYMTVITLSTVGFQEVRSLSAVGRIFTIGLLIGGVGVFFYTAVAVAEKVIAGELQQLFGRRRMEKAIGSITEHYIVCGFGRVGQVISHELASKPVPFVVIDQREERVSKAEQAQYLVLEGDASDEKVLLTAGVAKAKGLFAALPTDADNVFVVVTAKELNPSLFVVARAETQRSVTTLTHAGADKVISPYAMGGYRMALAALRPAVDAIFELATHQQSLELQLEEFAVAQHSPCDGVTLRHSGLCDDLGVIVAAIKRASGRMVFNPSPEERLESGDRLVALGEPQQLKALERRLAGSPSVVSVSA